jgi:hypothetical protein
MTDLQGEVDLDGRPRPRYPLPQPVSHSRAFRDTMKNPNSPRFPAYFDLGPGAWRSAAGTALLLALFLALNCRSMTQVLHQQFTRPSEFLERGWRNVAVGRADSAVRAGALQLRIYCRHNLLWPDRPDSSG